MGKEKIQQISQESGSDNVYRLSGTSKKSINQRYDSLAKEIDDNDIVQIKKGIEIQLLI